MNNKVYAKAQLLAALEAVRIATVKGVFTEGERRMVVEDLISNSLSERVGSMLESRKGIQNECGELETIKEFFG